MMRWLGFWLCSLFVLYAAVSSHPLTGRRGNDLGKPFLKSKPEKAEHKGEKADVSMPDNESKCKESSVVIDSEPDANETRRIAYRRPNTSTRRGRKDRGSHSRDHSHSSSGCSRHGSESKSNDVEDWFEEIGKKCDFKMEMMDKMEKVTPAEVRQVLNSAAGVIEEVTRGFSQHGMDISELEGNMAGRTPAQLVASHIDLLYQFKSLVKSAVEQGMCDFVSMQMLLDRITFLGSENFVDSRCNEARQMVSPFDPESPDRNAKEYVTLQWLLRFGAAIRNDMNCIIKDIEALSEHVSSLRNLAETAGNPSLRDVHIGLSTTMAYQGMLEHELDEFRYAVERVGEALQHVDLHQWKDVTMKKRYQVVSKLLKRLLSEI